MVSIEMPLKDYTFLKKYFDDIDRYIIGIRYLEKDVIFDIQDQRFEEFKLDYRSMIVRKGYEGRVSINDIGVRMNHIYDCYIEPTDDFLHS
ncbi:MAG: hypothetical protein IKR11_05205 [Solobacterium sp.]|nr:hypothetical protein [Solobacterium sp.]